MNTIRDARSTKHKKIQKIDKGDGISILRDSFPGNFPSIKIIQTTKAEIKSTILSLKQKKIIRLR
jgi:hypothetical protein